MEGKKYYIEPDIVVISMDEHADIIQTSGLDAKSYRKKLGNIRDAKKAQVIDGSELFN